MRSSLPFALILAAASVAIAKTGPTSNTPEELARAREQVRTTEWGQKAVHGLLDRTLGSYSSLTVRGAADKPLQYFWDLMPTTAIPRSYYVHDRWKEAKGCPVHGKAIFEGTTSQLGNWSFDIDAHPWKLRCPIGGEYYPSNDFAAGDMTSGEYPDDGNGWTHDGSTYYFIAVYAHYLYLGNILPTIRNLSEAYQLTGDPAIGRQGAALLVKIAQEYPNATTKADRTYIKGYSNGSGMITDCDWSPGDLNTLTTAYDRLYEAFADPELVQFISGKRPELKSAADVRGYVEHELLRAGAKACMDKAILGNHGAAEVTMTNIALVLDDYSDEHPNSLDCLEWVYYTAPAQIRYMASNLLFKDGGTTESPGYNTARLSTVPLMKLVERMRALHPDKLPESRYPLLFDNPKYRAMFGYFTDLVCIEKFMPVIGDMGGETLRSPVSPEALNYGYLASYAVDAYRLYHDLKFAQVAWYGKNVSTEPGFWADEALAAEIKRVAEEAGPHIRRESHVMDGYKVAFLRDGEGDNQRALWTSYESLTTHSHDNPLQVGLFAKGLDLLPGIGYPQSWKDYGAWEVHPLVANTVTIDRSNTGGDTGRMLGFVSTPQAQWMQLDKERVAPDASLYRRTLALVRVSDEECYAVDVFDVTGGSEHHLSYHGPQAPTTTGGLRLVDQGRGTLAGEDVGFGKEYARPGAGVGRDPFCLMTSVQRAQPREPWWVDYAMGDPRDVHLRLHGVPAKDSELILTDGRGPTHREHYTVKFVLEHRQGQAPLASRFVSVLEPYEKQPFIQSVARIAVPGADTERGPVVVKVRMATGTDYVLLSDDPSVTITLPAAQPEHSIRFRGRFGLVRERDGVLTPVSLIGGSELSVGDKALRGEPEALAGRIVAVDRKAQTVDVDASVPDAKALVGRAVRFFNDQRTCTYTITGSTAVPGGTRLTLDYTSVIGEGVAASVSDYVAHSPVLTFFGGLGVNPDGTRTRGHSLYVGATLENEDGSKELPVEGLTGGGYWGSASDVYIDRAKAPEMTGEALQAVLKDADGDGRAGFTLHDYGVGDRVEVLGRAGE